MDDVALPATRALPGAPAAETAADDLLPTHALRGHRIGISVSDSDDLARLGLADIHFKLAVRELARTVLVGSGTLAYGGHLRAGGFTEFLIGELGQYASVGLFDGDGRQQDVALLLCLSHQEHRKCTLDVLDQTDRDLGLYGEMRCLDLNGQVMPDRRAGRQAGSDQQSVPYPTDRAVLAQGLTALRHYLTDHTAARMLIGGRRQGYTGAMPGLMEEALLSLRAGQPLYLAAGLGGVTLNIAAAIDPTCAGVCPTHDEDPPLDAGALAALEAIRAEVGVRGWSRLNNGLDEGQNRHLAMTHRPTEIASLVGLGLGRWAQRRPV